VNVAEKIVQAFVARKYCQESGDEEWATKWTETLENIEKNYLTRGSGFDSGTKIVDATDTEISLYTEFHHMDEDGFYTHWTRHRVIVRPTFSDLDVQVQGQAPEHTLEYMGEMMLHALTLPYEE